MIGQWQKGQWQSNVWLRRGLFVLLNAAALSGLLCLLAWPIQAFFADRDGQVLQQRASLAHLNAIAAQRATVVDLAAQSASNGSAEFLQGGYDGVAAANLQTLVKGMVEPTGARLRSVRTASDQTGREHEIHWCAGRHYRHHLSRLSIRPCRRNGKAVSFHRGRAAEAGATNCGSPPRTSSAPTVDAQLDIVGAMQIEGDK